MVLVLVICWCSIGIGVGMVVGVGMCIGICVGVGIAIGVRIAKMKKVGSGRSGHVQNSEIEEMRSFGLSHKQTEKLIHQIDVESFPGTFTPII